MEMSIYLHPYENKTISVLGWAFKKDTNDSRESASIYLTKSLIENNVNVKVYDPMVSKENVNSDLLEMGANINSKNLKFFNSPTEAIKSSSGIAICTEWDEFKNYDWKNIYNLMDDSPWVFDGRNILNIEKIKGFGFNVYSIGK